MSPLPVVRPIGNLERYSVSRTNAGLYYNVVVGTRLQLQPGAQGPQTVPQAAQWLKLLTGPLTWLVQKHPSLSVVVGDHLTSNPTFLRMPSVDLSKVVRVTSIHHSHDINKVLEEEHAKPFDFTDHGLPLWRIIVAHVTEDDSFYILYAFGHMIADGRSGVALTEQLVERLNYEATNASSTTETLSTIVVSPTDPLPEPLEKRANCYPSIPTLVKEAVSALLLPPFIKKAFEKKYWAGEFDATLEAPHETQVGYWRLTEQETKQVIQAAKTHNTTVHAILYSASVFATKAVFLSQSQDKANLSTTNDALVFTSPVATRPLLTPPIDKYDQGSYTSEIVTRDIHIQLETSFWGLSKALRDQIVQGTQTPGGVRDLLEHIGLLQFVPNHPGGWEEFLRSKVTKEQHGRGTTLELSNVGRAWDQPKDKSQVVFKVQEGIFSQSAMITGPALMLNAATANGVLTVVGTWQRAAFSGREKGEAMLGEFKRILLQVTEPGKEEFLFREALAA
ncbi:hypothetical protein MVEG_11979 [Podila verticillata NRRL 6337]|uniref:Condensation domain-containing protein n=1 Tax=Podila verticillata NRRL 6337 TaxID=1069443 RepID=A0A086TKV9_9FUNG|nr:hypothetical protein MVEG_11979 [Podila verticillata NRRL 6337]